MKLRGIWIILGVILVAGSVSTWSIQHYISTRQAVVEETYAVAADGAAAFAEEAGAATGQPETAAGAVPVPLAGAETIQGQAGKGRSLDGAGPDSQIVSFGQEAEAADPGEQETAGEAPEAEAADEAGMAAAAGVAAASAGPFGAAADGGAQPPAAAFAEGGAASASPEGGAAPGGSGEAAGIQPYPASSAIPDGGNTAAPVVTAGPGAAFDSTAEETAASAETKASESRPTEIRPAELKPAETKAGQSGGAADTASEDAGTAIVLSRLQELDDQIAKNRASSQDSTSNSLKAAAETERKLWESELSRFLDILQQELGKEEKDALMQEQNAWTREREAKALEASQKLSSNTLQELEYNVSLKNSTRERVYALARQYGSILSEAE